MGRKIRHMLFAVVFIFLARLTLPAQVKIHNNLNIEDGLVYSQVLFIHEDQQGYMWFGTSSGISRWDGIEFKNYIMPKGLSDNNCKWIAEFSDSTLFFATRRGVAQYVDNKFSAIPGAPEALNHWIHSMLVTNDDKLFIATDTSGLWIYDGRNFSNIDADSGLPSNSIYALAQGTDGKIFLGFSAHTIYEYQRGKLQKLDLDRIPHGLEVTSLFQDDRGALWIGTEEMGVFIHHQDKIKRLGIKDGLPSAAVTQIIHGKENQIFIATDNGLAIVENDRVQSVLNDKNGLSNNFVWFVDHDRNGIYYIGTDGGGVDVFRPGLFQTFNTDCGLPHNTVWTICESHSGTLYFGTDEGLAIYDGENIDILDNQSGLSDNMVLCLHAASDGKIYVGTNEHGIDVIDQGKIKNINSKDGLDGPSVWSIAEDNNGLIYFATYDGGINIWDGRRVIDTINVADGLPTNAIVSSYQASDGTLYFGTDGGGVFSLQNGKIDQLLLNGNTIWSIYEDAQQNLYFGTNDRGMIYFRDGRRDTLSIDDGLSHNSILGILEDDQGKLYLSADNGLNVVEFTPDGFNIRVMGRRDGLASNECNQGAYFKDSRGFLWIGTVKGVSRFNPELYKPNTNPPQMHLTSFKLFDKDLPLDTPYSKRTFSHNENYFKFEFRGIDLSAPHKVEYRYRLSGVDENWVRTNHPNVQYTSLDDGDYTFEVMAGNEWGFWSRPKQLSFTVIPPIWERWWFIILTFLIMVSPLFVVIRQRIKRLLLLERLRTKIAADLHDDIGAGLTEISILSAVATAKAPPETKQLLEKELTKIGLTARSLIESMSDIVWLVNPKKDTVTDLISRLRDSFIDVFEARNITFITENTESLQKLHLDMEHRQHLFMILKEAVHNALKYSQANEIKMQVNHKGKFLSIKIDDNGSGFDVEKAQSGNGLTNMRERAAKIGGSIRISSRTGKGTSIEFQGRV